MWPLAGQCVSEAEMLGVLCTSRDGGTDVELQELFEQVEFKDVLKTGEQKQATAFECPRHFKAYHCEASLQHWEKNGTVMRLQDHQLQKVFQGEWPFHSVYGKMQVVICVALNTTRKGPLFKVLLNADKIAI